MRESEISTNTELLSLSKKGKKNLFFQYV